MRAGSVTAGVLALAMMSCSTRPAVPPPPALDSVTSFAYQLQGYGSGWLEELERSRHQLAIIDLSRDGSARGHFGADEVGRLRGSAKLVLAYFEIGSIEEFRHEWPAVRDSGLVLNRWHDWPDEHFVRYWENLWWESVVRPRVDQAIAAGFDGVYLDTPLAYEELDLKLVRGETRESLGRRMADLIIRISVYAKARRPGMLIVPQNSPELRHFSGYTEAIDGIGMEELFFQATDRRCAEDWCEENLAEALALRRRGKAVLATDYAVRPENVRSARALYRKYGFAGNVTVLALDRISEEHG